MKMFTARSAVAIVALLALPALAWRETARSVEDLGVMPQASAADDNMVVIVKTCSAYHSTRLKSVLDSWLGAVPNKFVVTDGPVRPSLGQLQASEVIVSPDFELEVFLDESGNNPPPGAAGGSENIWFVPQGDAVVRSDAYLNPFRPERKDGEQFKEKSPENTLQEYKTMPALARRVAKGLTAAWDLHGKSMDWYVIADDDTFLRTAPLRAYLSLLNPDEPQMIGRPVNLPKLLTSWSVSLYGDSFHHCAGNAWALSRGAMAVLMPELEECLETPHAILRWYYDEITIGRCLNALLGIECQEPQTTAHEWFNGAAKESLFYQSDDKRRGGPITAAPISFHPVMANEQENLRSRFPVSEDDLWSTLFKQQQLHGGGPTKSGVLHSMGGIGEGISTTSSSGSSSGDSNGGPKKKRKSKRIATNGFGASVMVEESIPLEGTTSGNGLPSSPRHSSQRVKPMEVTPARKSRKSRSSSSSSSSTSSSKSTTTSSGNKKDSHSKRSTRSQQGGNKKKGQKKGSSSSKASSDDSTLASFRGVGSSSPIEADDLIGFSQGRNYPVGVLLEDWEKALDFALKQRKKKHGWKDDGAYGTTVVRKSDVFACAFVKSLLKSGVTSEPKATVLFEKAFFDGRGKIGQVDPEALLMNEFAFRRFWFSLSGLYGEQMMGALKVDSQEDDDDDEVIDDEEYEWYDEDEEEEGDKYDSDDDEYDDDDDVDDYDDEYDDEEDNYGYEDEYEDEYDEEYADGGEDGMDPEHDYDLGGLFATVRPPSTRKKSKGARHSEL